MKYAFAILALLVGFAAGWTLRPLAPVAETPAAPPISERERPPPTEPAAEAPDPLRALLAAGDREGAVAHYAAVADRGTDPERAERMRAALLATAREASGRRELEAALELLEYYTFYYHRDTEALYLLADAAERLGRPSVALEALLSALDAALTGSDPEPARARVAERVDALAAGRLAIDDRQGAMSLYEAVLARDPLNHRYRFLLATQLEAAGDHRAALRALEQIPEADFDPVRLAELRQRIHESQALAERFAEGLPLTRFGDHFLVSVAVPGGPKLRLLLDTGASRSVIRPRAIGRIHGAERLPQRVRIGTANGVVSASRYRLPALELGPFLVDAPEVVVLHLEGLDGVDGLLGLDLLGRFDYRIDPGSGRLLLAR